MMCFDGLIKLLSWFFLQTSGSNYRQFEADGAVAVREDKTSPSDRLKYRYSRRVDPQKTVRSSRPVIHRHNLEAVRDRTLLTKRKSHTGVRLEWKSMTLDDLE